MWDRSSLSHVTVPCRYQPAGGQPDQAAAEAEGGTGASPEGASAPGGGPENQR